MITAKDLFLAKGQFTGWSRGQAGISISELAGEMGLTHEEWQWFRENDPSLGKDLTTEQIAELTRFFDGGES